MKNNLFFSKNFAKEAKELSKKFRSLKESIDKLSSELLENPYLGDAYGAKIYKVRIADKSKDGGKSGGFRVLYYHLTITEEGIDILLMSIFNKTDKATIKKEEALKLLNKILGDI